MSIPEVPKDAAYINGVWVCRCGSAPIWRTSKADKSRGKKCIYSLFPPPLPLSLSFLLSEVQTNASINSVLRCDKVGDDQCRFFIWEDNEIRARSLVGSEFPTPRAPLTPQTPGGRSTAPAFTTPTFTAPIFTTPAPTVPASPTVTPIAAPTPTPHRSYRISGGIATPIQTPHHGQAQQPEQQQNTPAVSLRGNSSSSHVTSSDRSKIGFSRAMMSISSAASVSPRCSSSDTFATFESEDIEDDENAEVGSVLFNEILELLRDEPIRLKPSTWILLRDLVNGEIKLHEMKLWRSKNTIRQLRRRLDDLERESADP